MLQIKTLKNKHLVVSRKNEVSPQKRDVLMAGVRRVLIFLLFLTHFSGLIIKVNKVKDGKDIELIRYIV